MTPATVAARPRRTRYAHGDEINMLEKARVWLWEMAVEIKTGRRPGEG